jgi:hypothetical protein
VLTVARTSIGDLNPTPLVFLKDVYLRTCPAADKKVAEAKTMDALSSLRQKEQINTEKTAHLQKQIDAQGAMVKKFLTAQDKDKAKMALKRKKMLEKQVEAVQNVRARCCCCCCNALHSNDLLSLRSGDAAGLPGGPTCFKALHCCAATTCQQPSGLGCQSPRPHVLILSSAAATPD